MHSTRSTNETLRNSLPTTDPDVGEAKSSDLCAGWGLQQQAIAASLDAHINCQKWEQKQIRMHTN